MVHIHDAENGTECKLDTSHDKQRAIWQHTKTYLVDFGEEMQTLSLLWWQKKDSKILKFTIQHK